MRGFCRKSASFGKKFFIVLIISLLVEGACFLWGDHILSSWAEDENKVETEFLEEGRSGSGSEDTEKDAQELNEAETSVTVAEIPMDTSETDISKPSISGTEAEDVATKISTEETLETDTEDFHSEESGLEISEDSFKMLSDEEAPELDGLTCLQIPEKLEVVIDPWEIDEKSQIYSEPFIVRNTGELSGVLTLSFTCILDKKGGVSIRESQEKLRNSKKKLLYMKAVLENGEEAVFTKEGMQCQVKLQPGEELALWFEGEVNENVEEPWKDGDIEIKGIYSWEEEEIKSQKEPENSSMPETEEKPSPGDETLTVETEKEPSSGDETLPTETEEKSSPGDETLPAEAEKESSSGDKILPTETEEKPSQEEKTLPVEKESSPGDETLPAETEEKTFPGDETLPIETAEGVSPGDETLPVETEQEPSPEKETSDKVESSPAGEETKEAKEQILHNEAGKEKTEENGLSENRPKEVKEIDG